MAGRDLVGLVRADLVRRAVVERDMRPALERVAHVVVLTRPRARDRTDRFGPAPARLEDLPAHDGIADLVDLDAAVLELANLIRRVERPMLGTDHARIIASSALGRAVRPRRP
jgi:hypothetical protein